VALPCAGSGANPRIADCRNRLAAEAGPEEAKRLDAHAGRERGNEQANAQRRGHRIGLGSGPVGLWWMFFSGVWA
jgi:hypothetical protein